MLPRHMGVEHTDLTNHPGAREDHDAQQWLAVETVAHVTITVGGQRVAHTPGHWSADSPGEQLIEVRFHRATSLSRMRVCSVEREQSRTQEMTVWATLNRGEQHRELVRQQFTFSPGGATEEVEEYEFDLQSVSAIQVRIVPSIDGRPAVARVSDLRFAA